MFHHYCAQRHRTQICCITTAVLCSIFTSIFSSLHLHRRHSQVFLFLALASRRHASKGVGCKLLPRETSNTPNSFSQRRNSAQSAPCSHAQLPRGTNFNSILSITCPAHRSSPSSRQTHTAFYPPSPRRDMFATSGHCRARPLGRVVAVTTKLSTFYTRYPDFWAISFRRRSPS